MMFPTIVYKCPGPNFGPHGTTYDARGANDSDALEALGREGWFASLPEAVDAFKNPAPAPRIIAAVEISEADIDDNAPPTREEMMIKAGELGLVVDRRWSDKTLAAKILEAIEAEG